MAKDAPPAPNPPRGIVSFQEIQNTITKLVVELDRKDNLLFEAEATAAQLKQRVASLEIVLDKFLKPEWRKGQFDFLPDLLEADTPAQSLVAAQ